MSRMELLELTQAQLATNCKMDRRTVAKRLSQITPHRMVGKRGFYYIGDVGLALFNPSLELGGDHLVLTNEKAGLAKAQRIRVEYENAVKEESLCDMEEARMAWQDHIGAARAKMLSLPSQLANRCEGLTRENIEDEARKLVNAALDELSRDESK